MFQEWTSALQALRSLAICGRHSRKKTRFRCQGFHGLSDPVPYQSNLCINRKFALRQAAFPYIQPPDVERATRSPNREPVFQHQSQEHPLSLPYYHGSGQQGKKGEFATKIIIFRSLRKHSEGDFHTFAAALHDVPGAKANKRTLTIEANGHRVEFRNGSPYDPKNAGLHADITIPHYGYITAGSEYEKDPRFRNCSFTRVLEIMKGIVKP